MSDFDDLRNLASDDDDFSFDDLDFDDEVPFERLGKAIGEDDDGDEDWDDTDEEEGGSGFNITIPEPVLEAVGSINSLERLILSAMLFGNVLIIGITLLLITGRIGG